MVIRLLIQFHCVNGVLFQILPLLITLELQYVHKLGCWFFLRNAQITSQMFCTVAILHMCIKIKYNLGGEIKIGVWHRM